MSEQLRIKPPDLEAFIARAFEAVAVPPADAKIIAELMTRADVNGSEGHGVFRLPQYIRRIKGGAVNVRPNIRIERQRVKRSKDGVPVPPALLKSLNQLADELKIRPIA
jgi:LDH2 family malate/lactate/ureidoglycolate dehydrogenase